jgi:hypothetical protein
MNSNGIRIMDLCRKDVPRFTSTSELRAISPSKNMKGNKNPYEVKNSLFRNLSTWAKTSPYKPHHIGDSSAAIFAANP